MESVWQKDRKIPEFPRLRGEITTDVLVIGGGLTGLLTACALKEKGVDVILVEQGRICGKTTAHTTAKITAQHGLIYHKILKAYGPERAQMYYRANAEAVESLKALCRKKECPIESKNNFIYSHDSKKLEQELEAIGRIGLEGLYLQRLPLPVAAEAVGLPEQGQFDPLRLADALTGELTIYENTRVMEMEGTVAVTENGRIEGKKVVVATHFPFLNKHGMYFLKLYQHRSYMLALKGLKPLDAMYVDDSKTGFSFSSFGDYFLLGGGGHRTGKQGGSYGALRAFRERYYPSGEECFHWAAQDTMSLDGIPYIGQYSKSTPDLYVAAGFNKWGMTSAMVSARILSAMICGEEPAYAPVFSPSRSILKPQLLVNGFESAKNLLIPAKRRCPHLGCALKYNKEERSWDCACHGSRFSETGKVLDNPANNDLKIEP